MYRLLKITFSSVNLFFSFAFPFCWFLSNWVRHWRWRIIIFDFNGCLSVRRRRVIFRSKNLCSFLTLWHKFCIKFWLIFQQQASMLNLKIFTSILWVNNMSINHYILLWTFTSMFIFLFVAPVNLLNWQMDPIPTRFQLTLASFIKLSTLTHIIIVVCIFYPCPILLWCLVDS